MSQRKIHSELFDYLLATSKVEESPDRLPPLNELSQDLGVSVSSLREQLEVAKALGIVDVKPRTGTRRLPYSFFPAVQQSLSYAIGLDRANFDAFSELRDHLEADYWFEAVELLSAEDRDDLQQLMESAWIKLRSPQIKIPHTEHRRLHLGIYRRLNNPFVLGLLEAYWEAYEAVGLNVYADYDYLQQVWSYHQRMVDSICENDFSAGYQALVEHKDLLYHRPVASLMMNKT